MWGHIRTILLVTVVAALVWVFAEADTLREQKAGVALSLRVPTGVALVMEASTERGPTQEVSVDAVLEGPTASIERVIPALRETVIVSPGMEGLPATPGTFDVDLAQVLRGLPLLVDAGVGVRRTDPATVKVRIDELVEVELPVRVEGEGDFQSAPVCTPPKVRVFAPRSEAANLSPSSAAVVTLETQAVARLVPGRAETLSALKVGLPAEIANSARARIEPSRVDVTATVRSRTAEVIVARVPVAVRVAPQDFGAWLIDVPEAERFLVDVKVIGAPEVLAQIQNRTIPLVATVSLSYAELERAVTTPGGAVGAPGSTGVVEKDAVFSDVPTTVRFEVAKKTVRVRVERR
jgi:hypothetical protein